jgi:hypothetical protein
MSGKEVDGRLSRRDRERILSPDYPLPDGRAPGEGPQGLAALAQADLGTILEEAAGLDLPPGDLDAMFTTDGFAETFQWYPAGATEAIEVIGIAGQGATTQRDYPGAGGADRQSELALRVRLSATGLAQASLEDRVRIGGDLWAVAEILSQSRWTARVRLLKVDEEEVFEPGRRAAG